MRELLLNSFPAFLDVLALSAAVGVLGCRLWVLPRDDGARGRRIDAAAWARLRRLLGAAFALLTLTGFLLLAARALRMSRQPLGALPDILPTVLLETHYGTVWLVRTGALAGLWLGWWGLARSSRGHVPASMLGMAAVIAWSYSASGHAADWGDFTWTEWLHWLHVLTASLWSGSLLAMARLSSLLVPETAGRKAFIAHIMPRLARLASCTVIVVLATGLFQAAVQLGDLHALWHTDYGKMLDIKLWLVLAMLVLWLANRWALMPVLRRWLAVFTASPDMELQEYLRPVRSGLLGSAPQSYPHLSQGSVDTMTLWHRRLMLVGAILLAAVLLCAVLLASHMPPRGHAVMHHVQKAGRPWPACCFMLTEAAS